jgi:prepilin-type N-terminal cleavage/methylation domain-containing protein
LAGTLCRAHSQDGFTLVELLVSITMLLIVVGTTLTVLDTATRAQGRDQAYAQELTRAQTALARMQHDLRQAISFSLISPNQIEFQMVENGATYNILYDCTASDSSGGSYRRCARSQALAPASPAGPTGSAAGSLDIAHVANSVQACGGTSPSSTCSNGIINTFCNSAGTAPSGAVFFVQNASIPNLDGSTLACDEAHEDEIGPQLLTPTYIQIAIDVPASGDLVTTSMQRGLQHVIVLQSGVSLPNSDPGA